MNTYVENMSVYDIRYHYEYGGGYCFLYQV